MTSTKTSTASKAAMAIVVAAISITALAPAAYAAGPGRGGQDGQRGEMQAHRQGGQMMDRQMRGGRGGGQFLAIGCGPNAAERIETSLVSLGYRVDATAEQKTLLDALKTAALAAQAELATTCEAVMPAPAAANATTPAETPDMLERLQARLKIDEARVAAMTDVLPEFEAFFNSLTDEQKAALQPAGPQDGRGPGRDGDHRQGRPGMNRNG